MPGKTHEDSIRELAEKNPYTQGKTHDTILKIKAGLIPALVILGEPERLKNPIELIRVVKGAKDILPLIREIPRPTIENCKYPNSKLLCELRDWFCGNLQLEIRNKALETIINGVIIIYEYDPPYRHLIDLWLMKIFDLYREGLWLPIKAGEPSRWWKGRPYTLKE